MVFVTTTRRPRPDDERWAATIAERIGAPVLNRENRSLAALFREQGAEAAVVVGPEGARWENSAGDRFRFHPNLSALRVKELRQGGRDALVQVAQLQPGDQVLDCTLGLGADAIVASYVTGASGRVVGLESQPVIAALVEYGLDRYPASSSALAEAMKRIEVNIADYREYLSQCPDQSFDVVWFDPMFRRTVTRSSGIQPLKTLANPAPLDQRSVTEACRVARRRVILKERRGSEQFERLGFRVEKEASHHAFGVIDVG
ncbi:putative SAM-dependent methyltransferase [Desmospora activa DSM 45169]|uniref:Putative SAM-dependent methyltransferase n=1 Tax=Desmospora activa DSM 45169 TaxID=1121389 RepID=A0A2T4ZAH5_9BACL|nr:putative SAM-dependent methyltransferase [Desmospora activa DSM 45169]